jgi:hypothetical protein
MDVIFDTQSVYITHEVFIWTIKFVLTEFIMDHILRYHLIYEPVVRTHEQSLWNLTNLGSLFAVKIEISQQT